MTKTNDAPAQASVEESDEYKNLVAWMSMNAPYRHMMTFKDVLRRAPAPASIPRAPNCGRFLAETNDGRLLYLNHANEWQEMPNILKAPATSGSRVRVFEWLCEEHPDQPMGHSGCSGCGIPSDTALAFCANQLRHARQQLKEHREQEQLYGLRASLASDAAAPAVRCTYCGDTGTVMDRVDGAILCPECGYGRELARRKFEALMHGQDPAEVWRERAFKLADELDAAEARLASPRGEACNLVPPPETYGGSPDEPWTGKMPLAAPATVEMLRDTIDLAIERLDTYRGSAVEEVIDLLTAALTPTTEVSKGDEGPLQITDPRHPRTELPE